MLRTDNFDATSLLNQEEICTCTEQAAPQGLAVVPDGNKVLGAGRVHARAFFCREVLVGA